MYDDIVLVDASITAEHGKLYYDYINDGLEYFPSVQKWGIKSSNQAMIEKYASLVMIMLDVNDDIDTLNAHKVNYNGIMKSYFVQVNDYQPSLCSHISKKTFYKFNEKKPTIVIRQTVVKKPNPSDLFTDVDDETYNAISASMNVKTTSNKPKQKVAPNPTSAVQKKPIAPVTTTKVITSDEHRLVVERSILEKASNYAFAYTKDISLILNIPSLQYIANVLLNNGYECVRKKMVNNGKVVNAKVYVIKKNNN
jgi:hypothetical protein